MAALLETHARRIGFAGQNAPAAGGDLGGRGGQVAGVGGVSREVARQVAYDAKYAGYVARQQIDIDRQQRLAARRIPGDLDYDTVPHLREEAREKLARVRPADLAQAGRISGITPADLAVLMIHLTGDRGSERRTSESSGKMDGNGN